MDSKDGAFEAGHPLGEPLHALPGSLNTAASGVFNRDIKVESEL